MSSPITFAQALYVGPSGIQQSVESDADLKEDPRGVFWAWEPPRTNATYVLGCDPTVGITGWTRGGRSAEDRKTDNGVVEIFRVDGLRREVPDVRTGKLIEVLVDVQVGEYAAPVDAVEIARIANVLGRIYRGKEEDCAQLIYEAYPGPGMLTTQELLRLGYSNLWHWEYFADGMAEETPMVGWRSSAQSQKVLWYRSRRHLMERRAQIRSPWLWEEYGNAEYDLDRLRAKAASGFHDDRMMAANLCFWADRRGTPCNQPGEILPGAVAQW